MKTVRVEAPARLHWGMFDISGCLGRRFGGLGVAITRPAIILEATAGNRITATGDDAERAVEFARRYLKVTDLKAGVHLQIKQAIPHHVGLGSGTKLALAVGLALATLYDHPTDPYLLAQAVGRGKRSAVGLWTFAQGGLVVEGGRWPGEDVPAPLLMRYEMPAEWSCVVAIPEEFTGLSGQAEVAAFEQIAPSVDLAAQITHLTLMSLLPALVDCRLAEFGRALTQIEELVGECFSPVQGGNYGNPRSAGLVEAFLEWGAASAGQSSWGPAVYGLVGNQQQGQQLVDRAIELLVGQGRVELVNFDNRGVRVQTS
jgi:beta-ribofuranosylaminobenzene 5'-phosphate synthase